jgi:prefoldin alpha subunit
MSSIDLDKLSLDQLNQLKQQEEQRLQGITNRYAELRAANARFMAAKDALEQVRAVGQGGDAEDGKGKEIMVPLTASLYVAGRIKDSNKIMVELGTGYYAEKTAKDTMAFLERKMKLIGANSDNIVKAIQQLRQNIDSVQIAMQGKLMEIKARQEGQRLRAVEE